MTSCTYCHVDSPKLERCSNCKSDFYCSKQCQINHWKTHKKSCDALDGKDASSDPRVQDENDNPRPKTPTGLRKMRPSTTRVSDSYPSASANPRDPEEFVWGVKITHNRNRVPISERFVTEHFPSNHPIFLVGEPCPLPQLYGIPILIYSLRMRNYHVPRPDDNQPGVYLRVEPHSGLAPMFWQLDSNGDCFVVRQDRQPLSKELVETMYEYHRSLLQSTYFEKILDHTYPPGHNITPQAFQTFSDDFWRKEKARGRVRLLEMDGRW